MRPHKRLSKKDSEVIASPKRKASDSTGSRSKTAKLDEIDEGN